MLETIFTGLLILVFGSLIYLIFALIFYGLLCWVKLYDKLLWTKKLKKDPKYLTKVDPIYKLVESEWSGDMYVEKWELGYSPKENTQFWLLLLLYPIKIEYFQYNKVGSFHACERKEVVEFASKYTLEEYYDEKEREDNMKTIERDYRKNKIEELNKVFNENYE